MTELHQLVVMRVVEQLERGVERLPAQLVDLVVGLEPPPSGRISHQRTSLCRPLRSR